MQQPKYVEEKRLTFCHRQRMATRDAVAHAEPARALHHVPAIPGRPELEVNRVGSRVQAPVLDLVGVVAVVLDEQPVTQTREISARKTSKNKKQTKAQAVNWGAIGTSSHFRLYTRPSLILSSSDTTKRFKGRVVKRFVGMTYCDMPAPCEAEVRVPLI